MGAVSRKFGMIASDVLGDAAASSGREFRMTATDVLAYLATGERRHGDAPANVCGVVDPRDEARWCVLAPEHPGENHNRYAPRDGCSTWTRHHRDHGGPRA